MKNLFYSLCLLIGFSTTAQPKNFQIPDLNLNLSENIFSATTNYLSDIFLTNDEVEEEDEAFDFDIKKYLPANFNAYEGLFDTYESAQEEVDEPFDFDTTAYLPVGFNANIALDTEAYELVQEEADEAFDFYTKD